MAANLIQILNFKANFHQECELFSKIEIYANNGGHLIIRSYQSLIIMITIIAVTI